MSATPDFGDNLYITRVGDFLRYPRTVLIEALELGFASEFFYTDAGKIPNPFLYKKTEDGKDTHPDSQLEIADGWTEELNKTEPRPIIICQRDTLNFADSSLNARKNYDIWGTSQKFSDFMTVPLNFLCYSRVDVESEELALVTGLFLRLFREHLRNKSKFLKITSPAIAPTTPIQTDSRVDLFSTPVGIGTYCAISWKITWKDLMEAKDVEVNPRVKNPEQEDPVPTTSESNDDFWSS